MVTQNEPPITTAIYVYSITVVTKPGKSTYVGTRVVIKLVAIARYMYSHIMCIVLMQFPNTEIRQAVVHVQVYFINT